MRARAGVPSDKRRRVSLERRSSLWRSLAILGVLIAGAMPADAQSGAAIPPAKQAPVPPRWHADSVALVTPTGTLYGTLVVPNGDGPFPLMVIISGSGPTDRNGNSVTLPGQNNALQMLAEGMGARGVASVRYDKRGVAASAVAIANESALRFDMYADDAADWVRKFRADPRFGAIVVVGHSEGALIGLLAVERARADGYASISGIARPAHEVLRDQIREALPKPLQEEGERILKSLAAGSTVPEPTTPPFNSLFRASVQPYLISWFHWNPAEEIAKLLVPTLIVQGENDIQVAMREAEALKRAQPGARLAKIDGMNHVLKWVLRDQTQQLKSYSDPTQPVMPELFDVLTRFVRGVRAPER